MREGEWLIRRARSDDEAGAYAVCLQTGDSGSDATALFPDDPRALGHLFVGPYLALEPGLSFVLEDGLGICGYVLAALDSAVFYRRVENEWLPRLRSLHPAPAGDRAGWTEAEKCYDQFHHPAFHYPPSFTACPSHLHIDLLPRAQGRGLGGRMMDRILLELRERGSPGVHLGLSARNERAWRFYRKLGFTEIDRVREPDVEVIYLAKRFERGEG